MKKKSPSQSAFFNPRALIGLFVCFAGVLIAFFAFGGSIGSFQANATVRQPHQPQLDGKGRLQNTMTRQELVGLYQALAPADFVPPACVPGSEMFADVPASNPFCPWIEELSRRGITSGCAPTLFCPFASVTRQQMAPFLVKTQFPSQVPPGQTITGYWGFDADSDGTGDWGTSISYPAPMPSTLTVNFIDPGGLPTPECPGSFEFPAAAPGFLCVYANELVGLDSPDLTGNSPFGTNIYFDTTSSGDNYANGTWAATAAAP
jgi:hypothetical protein